MTVHGHAPAIAWLLRGNRPDTVGNCADTVRMLRGCCAEIAPDISPDAACPLCGNCVDVRRIFGGHECLNEVRGEASFPEFTRIV
jgi:hypothetical protein